MKKIPLRNRKGEIVAKALVDDGDYEWLNQWRWYAARSRIPGKFSTVKRAIYTNGKQSIVHMHRLILGITDKNIYGDHIDRNPLNNQRNNIRVANKYQNARNKPLRRKGTSPFIGVYKAPYRKDYWIAQIGCEYKRTYLGEYPTQEEAAWVYDFCAMELFGEFANLNFKY